jgi:hypothetical protein
MQHITTTSFIFNHFIGTIMIAFKFSHQLYVAAIMTVMATVTVVAKFVLAL